MATTTQPENVATHSPLPLTNTIGSGGPLRETRRGTVLLVEDEESVRDVSCLLLQYLGYKVISAESGSAALRKFHEHKGTVDLLLTDILMPGMNGPQLADQLSKMDPELKVVFMSGYSAEALPGNEATHFLQKPFTRETLAGTLREALLDTNSYRDRPQ